MKRRALLVLAALLLAAAPALAQERGGAGLQPQQLAPRERAREDRESFRRERVERAERRERHRFTREERDKLRQDLLDANREMGSRRR
jgi:hypothetical protein